MNKKNNTACTTIILKEKHINQSFHSFLNSWEAGHEARYQFIIKKELKEDEVNEGFKNALMI